MSSADKHQVGGTHYKRAGLGRFEHWNMAAANHLGYFESAMTKYVTRWRSKGVPRLDLEKAGHYLEKLLELAAIGAACPVQTHRAHADLHLGAGLQRRVLDRVDMDGYADANELAAYERHFCKMVVEWAETGNMGFLLSAQEALTFLKEELPQVEAVAFQKAKDSLPAARPKAR